MMGQTVRTATALLRRGYSPDFPAADIKFVPDSPCTLVRKLKEKEGKDIWICGGADIVRQLMEADLIEQYHISVIPTILGGGIPLFHGMERKVRLRLVEVKNCNGIVEMVYEKRQEIMTRS